MKTKLYPFNHVIRHFLIMILVSAILGSLPAKITRAGVWLTVTNSNDSGPGSLRQTVLNASAGDIIGFDPSLSGATITLATSLIIDKDLSIAGGNLTPYIKISGGGSTCDLAGSLCVIKIDPGVTVTLQSIDIVNGTGSGILNTGYLWVIDCHINGNSSYYGGGIYNSGGTVTIQNSTISGNSAVYGAGIFGSDFHIIGSVLSGNTADIDGGAIHASNSYTFYANSFTDNTAGRHGGGIYIGSGNLTVNNCTFTGNTAENGGGIYTSTSTLTVVNNTFYDNTAYKRVGGNGGGIFNSGNLIISNNTFSTNYASQLGGNIFNSSTLKMTNNILSDFTHGGDCYNSGSLTENISNLVEDGTCSSAYSGDPLLLPLVDNGGYTETMALESSSPAINSGDDFKCYSLDQRGVHRPQGAHCDIGAYELVFGSLTDFDGDGDTNISVFRSSNGRWYMMDLSSVGWALTGDLPVPGDYDGDNTTDIAVFRPSNGKWYVRGSSPLSWGTTGDIPVQADYDGDGSTELAVLRPSNGRWYIEGMGNTSWYQSGDIPVPCDYDGDGADEIAVLRPSNGKWYIQDMGNFSWYQSGDIPVPADYDGDETCDIAVYRPSNGNWYVQGQGMTSWGMTGDIPVPGDYNGDGDSEYAVLRPSNGKWYIKDVGTFSWYQSGDYPLMVRDTNADGDVYE